MAEDIIMPPPERAAKTALGTSTVTSYLKADDILKSDLPKGKTLDFGAGKGLGAKAIGADTYEPYVKSNPKYNQANQIKSNSYDKVTSLNVLNTIEPEARKEAVKNIGRVLKPNGVAVISTRGKDVEDAKIKTKAKDGYIIGKGEQARFQKGFTQDELKNYVQKTLGSNYKVESVKGLGKAAIKVKKLNVDPTPVHKTLSIKGANFPSGKLTKRFNEGGTAMKKQMELFEDGGLKDEGGMIDEISGNDVPPGSTREEVRDDIPAQLSEGEFVFPADVVRYIGLEKLMMMRQEAKQGLKMMEAMGQMGNSDEATMPDDLPFDETDLDMEDELEYNEGGVVQAQQGTYVAPTVPTGTQTLGTTPMGAPPIPQQVGAGVSGTSFGTPYVPSMGKMYGAGAAPYAPVTYQQLLGTSAAGAPQTKNVRYVNEATNQTRMIPHLLNADGTIGDTLYPVPQGFVRQEEAPKEEAKKTQVQTAKVKPVDTGGDSQDQIDREREKAMYGPGGGRISLGGDIASKTTMVGTGVKSRQLKGSVIGSTTFGIGYTLPGGVIPGAGAIQAIQAGMGNVPEGGTGKFTLNGVTVTKSAEVTNAIIKNPRGKEALALIEQHKDAIKARDYFQDKYNMTSKDAREIVEGLQSDTPSIENKDKMVDVIDKNIREGNISTQQLVDEGGGEVFSAYQSSAIDKEDRERATTEQRAAEKATGMSFADLVAQTGGDGSSDDFSGVSDDAGAPSDTEGVMGGEDVAKGSLITKRKASGKTKKKYMKRGGLASR